MTKERRAGGLFDPNTGKVKMLPEDVNAMEALVGVESRGLATDYSYMPVRTSDISQAIGIAVQADAGASLLSKSVLGGLGSIWGPMGTGIGWLVADAGMDIYEYQKVMGRENFWEDFINDMAEVGKSDSAFANFAEGVASGGSFVSGGEKAAYVTYEALLGKPTNGHAFGEMVGMLTTDMAASFVGGVQGIVGASALRSGLQEYQKEKGLGVETWDAVKSGAISGIATGVTGEIFMGLLPPMVSKSAFTTLNGAVGKSLGYIGAGAEFAAWGATHTAIESVARGEDIEIDAATVTAGFVAGLALHGGAKGIGTLFRKAKDYFTGKNGEQAKELLQIGSDDVRVLGYNNSDTVAISNNEAWNYANKFGRQASEKQLQGTEASAYIVNQMKLDGVADAHNINKVMSQVSRIYPNYNTGYKEVLSASNYTGSNRPLSKQANKVLEDYAKGDMNIVEDVISQAERDALSANTQLGVNEISNAIMAKFGSPNVEVPKNVMRRLGDGQ